VEEVVREVALETRPFSGVTTSRDLAAAGRKLRALGPLITAARKAEVRTFSRLGSATRPVKALGQAAGKMMRDIQAVRATCSRMYR
jgi:hypothetical protein